MQEWTDAIITGRVKEIEERDCRAVLELWKTYLVDVLYYVGFKSYGGKIPNLYWSNANSL